MPSYLLDLSTIDTLSGWTCIRSTRHTPSDLIVTSLSGQAINTDNRKEVIVMSSKTPAKTDANKANVAKKSSDVDDTVACFWSSSSADWYDDMLEGRDAA